MKSICFIPARGGSKGVYRKNIRGFCGEPLIVHSIKQSLSASAIDAVYVSTDDDEIATISRNAGADIITRPESIAGDTATTESAIEHAVAMFSKSQNLPDTIVLLQATSPIRPKNSINEALKIFYDGNFDSLLSISPTHRFFWDIDNGEATAQYDYLNRPRRQDMTKNDISYVENGSLYIFSTDHFLKTKNRLGGKIGYTIFPEEYSYEIDTEADFIFLEQLKKQL